MSIAAYLDPTVFAWPSELDAEDALQAWVDVDPENRRTVSRRIGREWTVGAFDLKSKTPVVAVAWGYGSTRERADRDLVRRMQREGAL